MTLNSDARFEWILILWFQKWHEELGEILLEHSKSEKLYIDGIFLWKAYNVLARKFQRNWVMKTKGDAKFKRKLTRGLKNDIRNLVNFHESSQKSEYLYFERLLLYKAYKVLGEKVQRTFVSWHWRVMQSLKKNWLLFQKMNLVSFHVSSRNSEKLHFDGLVCPKHIKF